MTAPQSPVEVLRAARKLIDHPEDWTQHDFAGDSDGNPIDSRDGRAVCFCSYGAISAATTNGDVATAAENLLRAAIYIDAIDKWNDDPLRTHAEVLAGFDRAIALAEQSIPSTGEGQ